MRVRFVTVETTPLADTIIAPLAKNSVHRLLVGSGDVLRGWCVVLVKICCHYNSSHFVGSHLSHSRVELQHDWRNTCPLILIGTFRCSLLICNHRSVKEVVFVSLLINNKLLFYRLKLDYIITVFEVRVGHDHIHLIFTTNS